jgi:hypothetical protein
MNRSENMTTIVVAHPDGATQTNQRIKRKDGQVVADDSARPAGGGPHNHFGSLAPAGPGQ